MISRSAREKFASQRFPPKRPPMVLIVNAQEWSTRSLESILWPNGYAVIRAYSGRQALERVRSSPPDLIVIDSDLPDFDSQALCSAVRAESSVLDSVPILMTSSERPSRERRLGSLRAGAWDFISYPLDAEELMLRLDSYMRAKLDADQARERAFIDEATGLYNIRGLERRAAELGSHAFRYHWPMACVVITPELAEGNNIGLLREAVDRIATSSQNVFRTSDAVGRLGQSEFAIIAPGTDAPGAIRLAERLSRSLADLAAVQGGTPVQLRAGYQAVSNYHEDPVKPMDMVAHATTALHNGGEGWIKAFAGKPN